MASAFARERRANWDKLWILSAELCTTPCAIVKHINRLARNISCNTTNCTANAISTPRIFLIPGSFNFFRRGGQSLRLHIVLLSLLALCLAVVPAVAQTDLYD